MYKWEASVLSYLVLARKYRPQSFADLVGQEQVSRTLRNALTTGRVAHAYLFSGPRGVGKTTAARLLAMGLACLDEDASQRPCGECANCLEIQAGQALDVIEVDGASNRGINEIRDLRETVKYLPSKSRYKVYIIDEVHALTKDAFNALLKTLEEPPSHVVFIFATTETHKVLPTILSRCQRYDFRRIRVEDIAYRLAQVMKLEGLEAEPAALEIIARQAEGGLRDSLSLLDQAIASSGSGVITADEVCRSLGLIDQALVRQVVLSTLAGEVAPALAALDDAYGRGYDFKDFGVKILEYIRSLTLVKVDGKNITLMNLSESEENDFLVEAEKHGLSTLNRHFDAWLKFQRDIGYSSHPRWSLEAQIIRLSELAPLMPTTELLERLGRLLAQNPPPRVSTNNSSNTSTAPRSSATMGRTEAAPVAPPLAQGVEAPLAQGGETLQAQGGEALQAQGGEAPLAQGGETPQAQGEETPQAKGEETPLAKGGEASLAQGGEAPLAQGEETSDGLPLGWDEFIAKHGPGIPLGSRSLLQSAQAEVWSAEEVSLKLLPGNSLGDTIRKAMEKAVTPLLEQNFGSRPTLCISQVDAQARDRKHCSGRLEEVASTPQAQLLLAGLPGKFTAFVKTRSPILGRNSLGSMGENGGEQSAEGYIQSGELEDDGAE